MYATISDVKKVLSPDGEQDTDDQTAASFSDTAIEDAINRAVAKIHTYLARRYAVPVDAVTYDADGVLRDWTSVIAAYYATLTYSRGQDIGENDPIRLRFNDVKSVMERVQSGNFSPNWPLENANSTDDVSIVNRYEGNLFSPDDFGLGDSRRPYGWGILPGWY